MIKKIKTILMTSVASLTMLAVPMLVSVPAAFAQADISSCLTQGTELNGAIGQTCDGTPGGSASGTDLTNIITTVVNIISIIVGVIAVIMIIWGGMKYITSGGESGKITSAKNTIIYALIGLVVVALAQFIVRFVLQKAGDVASS